MKKPLFVSLFYVMDYPIYKDTLLSLMNEEQSVERWLADYSTFLAFQSYVTIIAHDLDPRAINYADWLVYVANNAHVITRINVWKQENESLEL